MSLQTAETARTPAGAGADPEHSRFVQRVRRRFAAELPLLARARPGRRRCRRW
jgi:hypothetical protein